MSISTVKVGAHCYTTWWAHQDDLMNSSQQAHSVRYNYNKLTVDRHLQCNRYIYIPMLGKQKFITVASAFATRFIGVTFYLKHCSSHCPLISSCNWLFLWNPAVFLPIYGIIATVMANSPTYCKQMLKEGQITVANLKFVLTMGPGRGALFGLSTRYVSRQSQNSYLLYFYLFELPKREKRQNTLEACCCMRSGFFNGWKLHHGVRLIKKIRYMPPQFPLEMV